MLCGPFVSKSLTDQVSAAFANVSSSDPHLVMTAVDIIEDEWKLSKKWNGKATIEVYVVSNLVVNVGYVTGSALYGVVWGKLSELCPVKVGRNENTKCYGDYSPFTTKYMENDNDLKGSTPISAEHNFNLAHLC